MRCVGRSEGDAWKWNKEVNKAVKRKKEAHKTMSHNSTDENKRYKSMTNEAEKAFSKAMIEKAEEALTVLQKCPYRMVRLVIKGLKTDSKELEGGRLMRGSDGKQCFSEKKRSKV